MNQPPTPVIISGPEFYLMAHKCEPVKSTELGFRLRKLRDPKKHGCSFVVDRVRYVNRVKDSKPEIVWTIPLPYKTPTAADMWFREFLEMLAFQTDQKKGDLKRGESDQTFTAKKLSLKKVWPKTCGLLNELAHATPDTKPRIAERLWREFVLETFRNTGQLISPIQADEWKKVVRIAEAQAKKTCPKGVDPLEYELITGWMTKGYCHQKPGDLVTKLKEIIGYSPTPEALRRMISRLKLPSFRKVGRPKK